MCFGTVPRPAFGKDMFFRNKNSEKMPETAGNQSSHITFLKTEKERFAMLQEQIGANIRRLRQTAGLTQERLADILCVSHQMISKYESGVSQT